MRGTLLFATGRLWKVGRVIPQSTAKSEIHHKPHSHNWKQNFFLKKEIKFCRTRGLLRFFMFLLLYSKSVGGANVLIKSPPSIFALASLNLNRKRKKKQMIQNNLKGCCKYRILPTLEFLQLRPRSSYRALQTIPHFLFRVLR